MLIEMQDMCDTHSVTKSILNSPVLHPRLLLRRDYVLRLIQSRLALLHDRIEFVHRERIHLGEASLGV